uniref:Uncharacterized protein n=1 Tax=Arundo donax TaxID=35708 RepID=A0A0A9B093_ARUDO
MNWLLQIGTNFLLIVDIACSSHDTVEVADCSGEKEKRAP